MSQISGVSGYGNVYSPRAEQVKVSRASSSDPPPKPEPPDEPEEPREDGDSRDDRSSSVDYEA